MKLFFISYDLMAPGKDYQKLYDALKNLDAKKTLLSQWALKGDYTAESLRDSLKKHTDSNDRILVVESTDWASYKALTKINDI